MHYVGANLYQVRMLHKDALSTPEGGMFVFNRIDLDRGQRERRLSPTASIAVIGLASAILWAMLIFMAMEIWSSL